MPLPTLASLSTIQAGSSQLSHLHIDDVLPSQMQPLAPPRTSPTSCRVVASTWLPPWAASCLRASLRRTARRARRRSQGGHLERAPGRAGKGGRVDAADQSPSPRATPSGSSSMRMTSESCLTAALEVLYMPRPPRNREVLDDRGVVGDDAFGKVQKRQR
ncbi:hypothetical protein F4820DRAFT_444583 [Hypoxylon rubiginosum]|uniref:Uncharacterized protein n=1 Tax=Hypoxylon rubiginosum TaxID=110542 RepID=A0ACB9ZAR0_9PEZI|nr:hypothetical protein F4820DRAFT_444583 [Hypoxylon rubiginosum]